VRVPSPPGARRGLRAGRAGKGRKTAPARKTGKEERIMGKKLWVTLGILAGLVAIVVAVAAVLL
jgi:hypothetical protein